tara:strand:+ start:159 stop:509 length:351 start_codon:yes stop_codon:yes gene_type:complete
MKEQYIENFGQVVKGHSTGTVYVLMPHKHRNLSMTPTSCGGFKPNPDMVIESKRKTVKIFAIVNDEMREYKRDDGCSHDFLTYRLARKIVDGIESDRGAWTPEYKVNHHFVASQER